MKTKRNLSGIYFRSQDETGRWGNTCFEDLDEARQDEIMNGYDKEALMRLAKKLADTLNTIGEQFDIAAE